MTIAMKKLPHILLALLAMLALALCLGAAGPAEAAETLSAANAVTTQAKSSPAISSKAVSMQVGKTTKLKVTGGSDTTTWKSSSPKVVSVSKSGKVRARKAGTATVTATSNGKKLTCAVTVAKKSTKTLVVYFSQSGTTKAAAQKVKAATGGDLLRIYPKTAYTTDYDKLTKLAQKEYRTKAKPTRATKALNMKQYSTVYVGFPVWWDNMPRLVQCFLGDYDLKGKTVVPFCTSGGSGIDGSMKAARASAKGATVLAGRDLTGYSKARVKKWVVDLAKKQTDDTADASAGTNPGTDKGAGSSTGTDTNPETETGDSTTGGGASIGSGTDNSGSAGGDNATVPADPADSDAQGSKTLVAYFSATNTTKPYAEHIANKLGAELYRIEPTEPYTAADLNYNSDCRANREQNDPSARPAISGSVANMADYDTVFIGFPIWWGTCPKIIDAFMESYDFAGKTVVPFCTSGSTGISTAQSHIASKLVNSNVKDGLRIGSESAIDPWLEGLGLS